MRTHSNLMIVSLLVFVTIVVLAIPAALVFIPFTLLTGNVGPLYAAGSLDRTHRHARRRHSHSN